MFLDVAWIDVKSFVLSRNVSIQYVETPDYYLITAFDGLFGLRTYIQKYSPPTPDQSDFEQNFKSKGNQFLGNPSEISTNARAGTMFSVTTGIFNPASISEIPIFLLVNQKTNNLSVRIRRFICFGQFGSNNVYNLYLNTNLSNFGTPLTVAGNRQINQNLPVCLAYKNPSSQTLSSGYLFDSINVGSDTSIMNYEFSKWLDPGNLLLVTVTCSSVSNNVGFSMEYTEQ